MYREINVIFFLLTWVVADKIVVTVKEGKILGHREVSLIDRRLYYAFYGIPYAQPPLGPLRFKNPVPLTKWNSTFDATLEYHGACAQTHIVFKNGMFGVEDCLYLNIYTPNIPRPGDMNLKPVVIWIHGHAFTSCFSHLYGPDFFINNEVIFVTLTHRIGVFGFLKLHDNSDENMGLKDIVMALKWIRTNIKQFGGDKKKITLMGSSSGATFISLLMTTSASKLFSKAILQSGALFSPSLFQSDPESERNRLIQELKRRYLELNTAPTSDIIKAAHDIYIRNNKEMIDFQRAIVPFTPTIELESSASLLTKTPNEFYDLYNYKKYIDKPILLGYNSQESISEVIPFIHNPYYLKGFIKNFKYMVPFSEKCRYNSSSKTYKKISNIVKNRYFKDSDTKRSLQNLLKYASDLLKYPVLRFAKSYLNIAQSKLYMYKFDYRGSLNAVKASSLAEQKVKISGAASGDEICYLLRCEPIWEAYKEIEKNGTCKDKKFIKDITTLWVNFVKYANPTPHHTDTNVTWLPLDVTFNNVLLIRKYIQLINPKEEYEIFNFWDLLHENYYKKEVCHSEFSRHDEL